MKNKMNIRLVPCFICFVIIAFLFFCCIYPFIGNAKNVVIGQTGENQKMIEDVSGQLSLKVDNRNVLLIADESNAINEVFPYVVFEKGKNIWDYTIDELSRYQCIYICQPVIDTVQKQQTLEQMVSTLVEKGARIVIEPVSSNRFDLFGVHVTDETVNDDITGKLVDTSSEMYTDVEKIKYQQIATYSSLYNLDQKILTISYKNGKIANDIIGTKKIGLGEVLFLGGHFSQFIRLDENAKSFYNQLFLSYHVLQENYFEEVPVTSLNQPGLFSYETEETKQVVSTISDSPRWEVFIDNNKIEIAEKEGKIIFQLPKGTHQIAFKYVNSVYDKVGCMILIAGSIFLMLFIFGFLKWERKIEKMYNSLLILLQVKN